MAFRTRVGGKGGITVHGVEEAILALEKVELNARQASKLVVNLAGKVLADAMKADAPVGATGRLSKSIGVLRTTFNPVTGTAIAYVGPRVFYGRFVEQGTVKMAAEPYMLPAAEREQAAVAETAIRIYRAAINRKVT